MKTKNQQQAIVQSVPANQVHRHGLLRPSNETFNMIHLLSERDVAIARELMSQIDVSSPRYNPDKAIIRLKKMRLRNIVAMCHSEEFLPVKKFCETSPVLAPHWHKGLEKYRHPDFSVPLVDGSGEINSFSMLMGAFYYDCYKRWKKKSREDGSGIQHAQQFLEYACKAGVPQAWSDWISYQSETISELSRRGGNEEGVAPLTYDDLSTYVDQMLEIASQMGNRFWSAGFFAAGEFLEVAAIDMARHPAQILQMERLLFTGCLPASESGYPLCLGLMAGAVRCFYSAWLLSGAEESQRILEFLSPNGIFFYSTVTGWEELHASVLEELKEHFFLLKTDCFVPGLHGVAERPVDKDYFLPLMALFVERQRIQVEETLKNRLEPEICSLRKGM